MNPTSSHVQADSHVQALEKQITALSDALATLGRGTTWQELFKIIHRPGFTTPAEFAFLMGLLRATQNHVTAINTLQNDILAASGEVRE
jgi:hypothetical protein